MSEIDYSDATMRYLVYVFGFVISILYLYHIKKIKLMPSVSKKWFSVIAVLISFFTFSLIYCLYYFEVLTTKFVYGYYFNILFVFSIEISIISLFYFYLRIKSPVIKIYYWAVFSILLALIEMFYFYMYSTGRNANIFETYGAFLLSYTLHNAYFIILFSFEKRLFFRKLLIATYHLWLLTIFSFAFCGTVYSEDLVLLSKILFIMFIYLTILNYLLTLSVYYRNKGKKSLNIFAYVLITFSIPFIIFPMLFDQWDELNLFLSQYVLGSQFFLTFSINVIGIGLIIIFILYLIQMICHNDTFSKIIFYILTVTYAVITYKFLVLTFNYTIDFENSNKYYLELIGLVVFFPLLFSMPDNFRSGFKKIDLNEIVSKK